MTGKLSEDEKYKAATKRQEIINNAEAMKRLIINPDFQVFCEMLEKDKELATKRLLNEKPAGSENPLVSNEFRVRMIARVNQIDRILNKPKQSIWQLKNLTEVRAAVKEKTHERQALGKKTGG